MISKDTQPILQVRIECQKKLMEQRILHGTKSWRTGGRHAEGKHCMGNICVFLKENVGTITIFTIQCNLCMNANLKLGLDHYLRRLSKNNFLRGMAQQGVCILQAVVLAKLLAQGFPLNEPTHLFHFHWSGVAQFFLKRKPHLCKEAAHFGLKRLQVGELVILGEEEPS